MTTFQNNRALNTIGSTDTLKGIAIFAVLINHYLNLNIEVESGGFANLWISIFFILSGYGIYLSLERRFTEGFKWKSVFSFYYDRFIRIFPLLWLAWILQNLLTQQKLSIWTLTGIHGDYHFWFIPALIQCYCLSIPIFYAIKRNTPMMIAGLGIAVIIFNTLIFWDILPSWVIKVIEFTNSEYRSIFLLHIIIFSFGMLLASYPLQKQVHLRGEEFWIKNISFVLFIGFILVFMIALKFSRLTLLQQLFQVLPLLSIAYLCIYVLRNNLKLSFFEQLGTISYSLYLYHMIFYELISRIGGFSTNSFSELMWTIILSPILVFICMKFEKLGNFFTHRMKR
jgi:peptidoglycan/LPS O-acetylase OafA/YrhL